MSSRKKPNRHPNDEETKQALEKSGYPLEVKLYRKLQDRGFDPTIGHRFAVGDASTEVDLLARRATSTRRCILDKRGHQLTASILAMMEVKNLQPHIRMVGVKNSGASSLRELRALRSRMQGVPSWNTAADIPDAAGTLAHLLVEDGLWGGAFDRFDAPLCVHWAKVEFEGKGGDYLPWARGDDEWRRQLNLLVSVSEATLRRHSEHLLNHLAGIQDSGNHLSMRFHVLTLVVATPHGLGLYDPEKEALTTHDWLTLRRVFDVGDGRLTTRVIEIVTAETGLDRLLDAMEAAANALDVGLQDHAHALATAAEAQIEWWRRKQSLDLAIAARERLRHR